MFAKYFFCTIKKVYTEKTPDQNRETLKTKQMKPGRKKQ